MPREHWPELVLIDENPPKSVQDFLEVSGVVCAQTRDCLRQGATDHEIMKVAHVLRAAIVTMDKDFKRLWAKRKSTPDVRGLLLLDCDPVGQVQRLRDALSVLDAEFARGLVIGEPPFIIARRESIVLVR